MSFIATLIICIAILVLTILSLKTESKRNYKNEIVSLGVLGTFIGILFGLFGFEVSNIERSLPFLLEGLKTAFITSGVGMFCSIIISIRRPVIHKQPKVTLEHISQNQQEMILVLKGAINDISSSANEEIIISLEQVVKEFNSQLNEQFGQNFKELNCGVKSLVTWQSNYKEQVAMHDESIKTNFEQLQKMSKVKEQQEKNIERLIHNMSATTDDINKSLKESTDIVEENLQLLLRKANSTI
jgi:uncharacterized protein YifE (UPF0438 family)